jgi:hypothetical protein
MEMEVEFSELITLALKAGGSQLYIPDTLLLAKELWKAN